MRNDMHFYFQFGDDRYCFAISMDYLNNLYGWSLIMQTSDGGMKIYEDGQLHIDVSNIVFENEHSTKKWGSPKIANEIDFAKEISCIISDLVIYTGAGLSTVSHIWDLSELKHRLLLDQPEELIFHARRKSKRFIYVIKDFAGQLYGSDPPIQLTLLSMLQKKYNFSVVTENRDLLQQKSGITVYNRDILMRMPILFSKKRLLIIGVSEDHSGFIDYYRQSNKDTPVYILNKEIPIYSENNDVICLNDAIDFIDVLYNLLRGKENNESGLPECH